jgi:CAAX prenyl protease-like protein
MPTSFMAAAEQQLPINVHLLTEARGPKTFGPRLALSALAFTVESVAIAALHHPWLHTVNLALGPITFLVSLLFFGRRRLLSRAVAATSSNPVSRLTTAAIVALHVASVAGAFALQASLLHTCSIGQTPAYVSLAGWYICLLAMAFTLALSACPLPLFVSFAQRLGLAWVGAAAATAFILSARSISLAEWDTPSSWLGNHLAAACFQQVITLLQLVTSLPLVSDPATRILGTPAFRIHLAGRCSGVEGLALTFVLTVGYIFLERQTLRLARAVWLVPAALLLAWCSNVIRLAVLIVIGNAGYPAIALNGFHSEAGWIAFSAIAIGFLLVADHSHFFRATTTTSNRMPRVQTLVTADNRMPRVRIFGPGPSSDPTTTPHLPRIITNIDIEPAFLFPLLSILATGLITRAVSDGFEKLYPLRFFVAAAVIFCFRKHYGRIRWRVRPADILTGLAVGILWIAATPFVLHLTATASTLSTSTLTASTLADGIAHLRPSERLIWLTFRILAAVLTVPFAEELAFRGYLARRISTEDPGTLPYLALSIPAILLSSAAFAALHGSLWPLGFIAGLAFAITARMRNGLGAAIVAHAVANLTLAVWVLTHGAYNLW